MTKSIKKFLFIVLATVFLAQITSVLFLKALEKEFQSYTKDKEFMDKSVELYALACSTPSGMVDKECIELSDKVHVTYYKLNNEYKLVNFYLTYLARDK
jgi:cytochrome c-type biogenesis protein CcmE